MKNADMPAMPVSVQFGKAYDVDFDGNGLTKREYFAAMAMQGNMAARSVPWEDCNVKYMTKMCLEAADALLEALEND